jgi:uncharacterized protein YjbI with pentapeptide repeats
LKSGVNSWNSNRPADVDLSHAKLQQLKLRGINLSNANLMGANLRSTDLQDADLSDCDLREANLGKANLSGASLCGANLEKANLRNTKLLETDLSFSNLVQVNGHGSSFRKAKLQYVAAYQAQLADARFTNAIMVGFDADSANFRRASFHKADLTGAWLGHSDLTNANLRDAIFVESVLYDSKLSGANLTSANLTNADLRQCTLVGTTITDCILQGNSVYGISAWDIEGTPADQTNLLIFNRSPDSDIEMQRQTAKWEKFTRQPYPSNRLAIVETFDSTWSAPIRVDNLEVAQFVFLLLKRKNLRNIIETITSKTVLILGRFTSDRKVVLNAIAQELRKYELIPIIFDFEGAKTRDFTETIKVLAGMSLFVIADITNPKSAPLELGATVPNYQIPFLPIIQEGEKPFSMFNDLMKYDWVLEPLTYSSLDDLLRVFKPAIIDEAYKIHTLILSRKAKTLETRSVDDYLKS